MPPATTTCHCGRILWNRKRCTIEHILYYRVPLRLDPFEVCSDSVGDHCAIDIISLKHLTGESPQGVYCILSAGVTFFGSVSQANHPFTRVSHVITRFLEAFCRDAGE